VGEIGFERKKERERGKKQKDKIEKKANKEREK
jgi:hypothetical protein